MVATAGSLDDHVNANPVRALPCASSAAATACVVCPRKSDVLVRVSVTLATEAPTVSVADWLTPSLMALMAVAPRPTAVMVALRPLPVIVATAGLLDDQTIVRPVSAFP
jgi:hypothetical protein